MTVAELIKQLEQCDQDKEVYYPGEQFSESVTHVVEDEHGVFIG